MEKRLNSEKLKVGQLVSRQLVWKNKKRLSF
jgi:hypothetical protein